MDIPTRLAMVFCVPLVAAGTDPRASLRPGNITEMRLNLNPWGPHLGFETRIAGDDPRVETLAALIREAEPGGGHKCANTGAVRFRMKDGGRIAVGLLPGHTRGLFEFRLYDGDRRVGGYVVDRAALLAALEDLGVPVDDPAFRE